ncbi:MAG: hypothetical protein ACYC69_10185 [Thermodesulfovibrionales bacterium]
MAEIEETRFLNVDLDIVAKVPLNDIVEAFGKKAFALYVGRRGRLYCAYIETEGGHQDNADQIIQKFVAMVKKLPREIRRIWDQAKSREFNIGIEVARKSPAYVLQLKQKTLDDIVSVDGTITFTVYPPEMPSITEKKARLSSKPAKKRSRKSDKNQPAGPQRRAKSGA